MLIQRERAAHWYSADGKSQHTIEGKKGLRHTTLRDARKFNWFPSVTSILSVKSKAGLDAWKLEQGIMSALTLPRIAGESDDDFAKRVVTDMEKQTGKAAEFGTSIHRVCEDYHRGEHTLDFELNPYVEKYFQWFEANIKTVYKAEQILVNKTLGYAGTVDLVCEHKQYGPTIIDLKTQGVKEKPVFYPEWQLQLSAYGACMESDFTLMSVVINSKKSDNVEVKKWEDNGKAFEIFKCCLDIWKWDKGYYPV